jgi:hypothetical protein
VNQATSDQEKLTRFLRCTCKIWLRIGLGRSPEIINRSRERNEGMWSLKGAIFAEVNILKKAAQEWHD